MRTCRFSHTWPSEPSDVINEELANRIISIAKIFANKRTVSLEEVELWIKHMSPKDDEDYISSKESLMSWYAEMTELKLTPEGSTFEDFVKFLGIDIGTNI